LLAGQIWKLFFIEGLTIQNSRAYTNFFDFQSVVVLAGGVGEFDENLKSVEFLSEGESEWIFGQVFISPTFYEYHLQLQIPKA
jgi:hypothetical protein